MKGQRIIIFTGGRLDVWALSEIKDNDMLVGADHGALFLIQHGFRPYLAVGDFDSVTAQEIDQIQRGSEHFMTVDAIMKDHTDTEMAFDWAIEQQPSEIIMIGALGSRFDHSLANVHLLWKAQQHNVPCKIIDAHNEIILVEDTAQINTRHYTHCSLLPFTKEVTGITLEGFRYPLWRASLTIGQTLGISNVIVEQTGLVSIESGLLLVILSKD